ncbi:MAG: aminoglycoside phosphotransferase family protein [Thermoleophilia bacterium]
MRVLCHGWRTSRLAEARPRAVGHRGPAGRGRRGARAYGKAYAPGTADLPALSRRYGAAAAALAGHPGLRAPRALAHSAAHDLLVLEAMPGERWDRLDAAARRVALARLGQGIAVLHGVDPGGLGAGPFGRLRPDRVERSCALVGAALPHLAERTARIARGLSRRPAERDRPVLLHGDCHPKNALAGPEGLALIDLDQAGVGAPAADVGSLLARLRHGVVLGETDAGEAAALAGAFLEGYAAVRPLPDAGELHWSTAAALMAERAVRAVNRVHAPALAAMDALLDLAEDALAEGAWR